MVGFDGWCGVRHEQLLRVCRTIDRFHYTRAGSDFILIPERPPEAGKWQEEMCEAISRVSYATVYASYFHGLLICHPQHRSVGKRKTIVIIAEGAHDTSLTPIKADDVKEVLAGKLELDTRVTTLGHTQRGGRPCYYDRILVSRVCILSQERPLTGSGFSLPFKP